MSVSGPTNTSSTWAVQPSASTSPTSSTTRAGAGLNTFDYLTDADKDLIYAATGQHIKPGDVDTETGTSILAATISFDRQSGRLSAGQPVTAIYLKDLARQQAVSGNGANPFVGEVMDHALAYLAKTTDGRTDVSA